MLTVAKQYSSAKPFFTGTTQAVVSVEDQERLSAYTVYRDFYYNRPETLKVQLRGDSLPIYLPSARKLIEATNRFLAVNFNFVVDPKFGSPADQAIAQQQMGNLFKREKFYTKFASQRRNGLICGDAVWHITADGTKPQGTRVSIHAVQPDNYFPIEDPNNPDRLLGCHLVDLVQDPRQPDDRTKLVNRRQTYRRVVDALGNPTGPITSEITFWEQGTWDDRNLKPGDLKQVPGGVPVFVLPPAITSVPVYHIRNNAIEPAVFGLSQIAGVETIVNGLNQAVTDEDLTLVMQGLGMYWTNSGAPENADGTPAPWNLGPGQVVEVGDGQTFGRVTGVGSVAPFVEHMNFIDDFAQTGLGVPDVAIGKVDVAVAESGISLKLKLSPILASNAEKELEILMTMDQLLWDINKMWWPAYEQLTLLNVDIASVVDDPMPHNRDAEIQEILLLQSGGLITIAMAQAKLAKLGYDFEAGADVTVVQEAQRLAIARTGDPFANRFGAEDNPQDALPSTTTTAGQAASVAAQNGSGPIQPAAAGVGGP